MTATLAIDFGTSNSAAAMLDNGTVRRLPIETGSDTLPTAVFFPADGSAMTIGQAATDALIGGDDGRFMRAMKSVLGTSLLHEARSIGGKRRSLAEIITQFLVEVKRRAEAAAGQPFAHVLSGRPVHFHTADPERDARAEADLRACYKAAGFDRVEFLFEPEAAALATHDLGAAGDVGLIVDIGGGTSDYSLFQSGAGGVRVLASHGIRLGGTDFDQVLSLTHAMPYLGLNGQLRREMGEGLLPVPRAVYLDLATWAKIPFLYTAETRGKVAEMVKLAVKPRLMRRLATVVQSELGHDLAFAVERGKIAANGGNAAQIDMGRIEAGLAVPITGASSDKALARFRAALQQAAQHTCDLAGLTADRVQTVILVGGSSLMAVIAHEARAQFPNAVLRNSEPFTAVVDGLALASVRVDG
ncbi:MAG: Hsp70 family protein [Pseudorhodobacter sp.]|nr:Hsp70 family protein [Pseudorhodobacter sp.]